MIQSILDQVVTPDAAALVMKELLRETGLYGVFHQIGWALIALFAMAELWRVWLGGGERDLAMLAAKVAILSYLLSGSPAPLETIVDGAYGYFARVGAAIAAGAGSAQYSDLYAALNSISVKSSIGGTFQQILAFPVTLLNVFISGVVWILFMLIFVVVLGLYAFAVLGSRVFLVVSILLAPLLLPCMLWRPMTNFIARWITTTLHAFLLPVIGAIALVAALKLGLVAPLKPWASCVMHGGGGAAGAYACVGTQMGAFLTAIIGGIVAALTMFEVDAFVKSYLGAVEVTTAGLLAAKMAMGPARRTGTVVGSAIVNEMNRMTTIAERIGTRPSRTAETPPQA